MRKPSEAPEVAELLGLGSQSARKSYYPELAARLEELEHERNRYKWLFEHAVHGIFQARLNEGICAANPALARMLGYGDPQEVLWSHTDLAEHLFVGGAEELEYIRRILRERNGLFGYETQLRRRDGSCLDVMMNLLHKPDEANLVEGFVADITERKQAQRRLQQLNDELERRVAERTEELMATNRHLQQEIAERERIEQALREARDAAEEANRSKDKFLAAASHDLLQPMNAARLLISTLRERALPLSENALVERAHQALEGAEELLSDLLDISRLDQAAIEPDLDVYTVDELFSPLASEFLPVAEAAGLRLQTHIPQLSVRTDARLLGRILRNLLSNACRYTHSGGVLLAARKRGDFVRLEVWDTGRGIPADQIEAIFLEFNQLDVDRGTARKGVGLGLAIVDRIAQILGSRVEVRSRLGRGSVFFLDVPLVPSVASRRLVMPLPTLGDPLPGSRLLVLDNEATILLSMAALLGQWGCEVLTAKTTEEALEALEDLAPQAILADYHLDDGVTGREVIREIRAHFAEQHIPVVMITADRSDLCIRELAEEGIPLLNKPVKPGKLRAVLSQLLQ